MTQDASDTIGMSYTGTTEDRFGINIDDQLTKWFRNEFCPSFWQPFSQPHAFGVVILKPGARDADSEALHLLGLGPSYDVTGPQGELEKARRKLRFTLRTGLPSDEAQGRLDLVEPGDFPVEGALVWQGYPIAVSDSGSSGSSRNAAWQIVNKLTSLREAAAKPLVTRTIAEPLEERPEKKLAILRP